MNWTEDTLKEIEEFAKLPAFTPAMIARAAGIELQTFTDALQDPAHSICQAYDKGQLHARAELDKKLIQLSNQGSGPAQALQYKQRQDTRYFKMLEQYG